MAGLGAMIFQRMMGPPPAANASGNEREQIQHLVANSGSLLANLGLGKAFPFTNGSVTDLTISGSDQTVAPTNGVLRYRTLTFSTAHTLRITATPCILMVDTLVWNAAGVISCEASGTPALGADPAEGFPRGGRAFNTGDAIGGYGGGFLIVLAGTVNGSTTGTIRANGTAGARNTTNGGAICCRGADGSMSTARYADNNTPQSGALGRSASYGYLFAAPALPGALVLQPGGDGLSYAGTLAGYGGGAGTDNTGASTAGGGSGTGGGGGVYLLGAPVAVASAVATPSLVHLLNLYQLGCRGGGGGGAGVHTTGANNGAGGGGGGCVILIVDTETQVSTLTAAGGAAAHTTGAAGGAGITLRQVI